MTNVTANASIEASNLAAPQPATKHQRTRPAFQIGQCVGNEYSDFGRIIGLCLRGYQWDYLVAFDHNSYSRVHCDCLEDWMSEDSAVPLDGEPLLHRRRWLVRSKPVQEQFLYHVTDLKTSVEATGLKPHPTMLQALVAGKAFVDREFPESIEES